jgi:hypothetical protein
MTEVSKAEHPPGERMTTEQFMDSLHVVTINGRSRMLTGGLCAAALLEWIIEILKDQLNEDQRAEQNAPTGPTLRQVLADGFVKLELPYARSMTLLNERELDVALENLLHRGLIVVNWPEEDSPAQGDYEHCWVRLNLKRMRELDLSLFGGE